ncbi:hypothetical protein CAEBREN_05112 [Caenorhabditis brenneri]|uniref:3'-5' exonuclease domain-containing protein n=1 Tax=Caenorhabditis brenneri TaxID=135651 RepID=G0PHZ9_CAEBE|nr:hypothetical protein CAEBREN_05112 [Caenorhabditis brenneri]
MMSDWTAPLLTHDQIYYAAMDAVVLHQLEKKEKGGENLISNEYLFLVYYMATSHRQLIFPTVANL